jgi:peroxiredoxin
MNAECTPNIDDFAPDFELVDSTGTPQCLSEMVSHGPLVLIFYRGHW